MLQIALDVADILTARELAATAVASGADLLEVGDPLIKRFGMHAVRQISAIHPRVPLVAELASSDWSDEQVRLAAEAGADIVLLMGIRTSVRMERAVHAARTCGVGLILELPPRERVSVWCRAAQEHGVDGIAVIRNIDSATTPTDSFRRLRAVRRESLVPIAVSGGFTPEHVARALAESWNIIIIGRAVVEAHDPGAVVRKMANLIHPKKA